MNDPMKNPAVLFEEVFQALEKTTEPRWSQQERLQDMLATFNPDYNEIDELLDSMFVNFKYRYSDGEWDRVEIALKDFQDKLYGISQMPYEEDQQ